MKGTKHVLVVGSGESRVNIKELVDRLTQMLPDVIVEMIDRELEFQHALIDLRDKIVEMMLSDDIEFGETSVPSILPRFTQFRLIPIHARGPPWEACTEHPKKSGIIERS